MKKLGPLEIEFKYDAKNITLTEFTEFCVSENPVEFVQASGWDHFYSNDKDEMQFGRHRVGPDYNQLTVKAKTQESNNYVRQEDNLNFKDSISKEKVASFFAKFDYEHKRSIFKNCFIYKFPLHTFVYYVIYTEDMNELGRYIEIEMSEEHPWESADRALNTLRQIERDCKPLGIIPQGRIRNSLYEIVCG